MELVKTEHVRELFINTDELTLTSVTCLEEYAAEDIKEDLLRYLAEDFPSLVRDYLESDYPPAKSILSYIDDKDTLSTKTYKDFWTKVFNYNKITLNDFKEAWLDVFGKEINLN